MPAQLDPEAPCPFCPGNEEATPPALETYGPQGEWLVRIVPNLYPAFSGRELMSVTNIGPVFTQAPASGIHEVVVFSPSHDATWADLSDPQAGLVMAAVRDRIEEHATVGGLRYSQFITNSGREAGASLDHPHGQLMGMPFVPGELVDEQAGFDRFQGACLLCTTLEAEEEAKHRIVDARRPRGRRLSVLERHARTRCSCCLGRTSRSCTTRSRRTWRRSDGPCATR